MHFTTVGQMYSQQNFATDTIITNYVCVYIYMYTYVENSTGNVYPKPRIPDPPECHFVCPLKIPRPTHLDLSCHGRPRSGRK